MSTKLKICGITALEDARYCAAKGADYLGFIQYEESPRFIPHKTAREIIDWVYGPVPVGVFVNATADEVNRAAAGAGFQMVQLHGDEPAFEVASVELPVIKAIRIEPETNAATLRRRLREYEDVADYFLLDTHSNDAWGGTGESFDWDVARDIASEYDVFVAGGIGAGNVAEAVKRLNPFAVDVSSSLESSPGSKDFGKVDAFMEAFERLESSGEVEK